MRQYRKFLTDILEKGTPSLDRTGVGTLSLFGYQMRFPLSEGFPIVTTKKVHFKSIVHELLWFISGSTNVRYLREKGVTIWDEWADENGDLGPVYGKQWRSFGQSGWDQLTEVITQIKKNPNSRRLIVTAWNPEEVGECALPPCHCMFQFYVRDSRLSCQLYQRSADAFLGVPFNISSYALLTHMVADSCGLEPGDFVHTFGDAHIYTNHIDAVKTQLARDEYPLPKLNLTHRSSVLDYSYEDIWLEGYIHHPAIAAKVAV